jgi:RNA polymerase sigma-70 factor (ECF subfamily)
MGRRRENPETPANSEDPLVAAFNGLRDELVSTLAYMLHSKDDAQDVAQEAFIKCWRARESVPDVMNLRAWIFRVALNAARDHQRSGWSKRSRPLVAEETTVSARDASVPQQMVEAEQVNALRRALEELRDEEREVFLLRQNGDLTYEQIAEMRNVPVGTVKTQMRTALIKLRKTLNPGADDVPVDE